MVVNSHVMVQVDNGVGGRWSIIGDDDGVYQGLHTAW